MRSSRVTQRKHIPKPKTDVELEKRITTIKTTIQHMERLPPSLGSKWRTGMLKYYRRVLAELESYRGSSSQVDKSSKPGL